jgi:radical SAM superfamily enzyme
MRKAGCVGLVFGFESASQRVLDILNKKTDVALHQRAVDACVANDIRPQSGFIIAAPGETKEDIKLSLDFIERNQLLSSLNVLLPLPGTAINRQLIRQGKLDPNHPDYWGMISDTNAPLTKERVYCDIPFDEFVDIYNNGMKNVCAPTWETLYIDKPSRHLELKDGNL